MTTSVGPLSGSHPTDQARSGLGAPRFDPGHVTRVLLEQSATAQIVEDVSQIVRCAPFIARCPNRMFTVGLASELAEAVDILACKVADLREAEDAGR